MLEEKKTILGANREALGVWNAPRELQRPKQQNDEQQQPAFHAETFPTLGREAIRRKLPGILRGLLWLFPAGRRSLSLGLVMRVFFRFARRVA